MTPETPLLSICIPTYNRCQRLDQLVQSIAKQITAAGLADRVEVFIVDNQSDDATARVGEKWAARHAFIRYARNAWNIGGDANQIRVVEGARGRYAWILGDDDRVHEGGVARVVSRLTPGVSQLFLDFRCVTVDGECLASARLHPDIPDEITTVDLVKRLGFVSVFSLISSHVFDRDRFLAADPQALLKVSPWYIVITVLLFAFHAEKCGLIREVVLDDITGNDRLADETVLYVRVLGLLNTLKSLKAAGKIDDDFIFGCYETGAGNRWTLGHPHYFREELYINLQELEGYWALPGRTDAQLIRNFIDHGPGFWDRRIHLKHFFAADFNEYRKRKKPVIHYWHGKSSQPELSVLLSSDDRGECEAFDEAMGRWPEEFAHESILVSRIPEEQTYFTHIDVLMAPFRPHLLPSGALNSGFRKALAPRVFVLEQPGATTMPKVLNKIAEWQKEETHGGPGKNSGRKKASRACLIFETSNAEGSELPGGLVGLYCDRKTLVYRGGFENVFQGWTRDRLLADAGYRLRCEAWAVNGGAISKAALGRWFSSELPLWIRALRTFRRGPISEHGLNITLRGKLRYLDTVAARQANAC